MSDQQQAHDSSSGCLLRLFWLLVGNVILAVAGGQILFNAVPMFSRVDAVYWSVVVLIVAARYADIRYFKGTTGDGEPASLADWRRHTLILLLLAGAAWVAVHLAAHFRAPIGAATPPGTHGEWPATENRLLWGAVSSILARAFPGDGP